MTKILYYIKAYNNYKDIFQKKDDYYAFIKILSGSTKNKTRIIHSFSLLPTSCHILIETTREDIESTINLIHFEYKKSLKKRNNKTPQNDIFKVCQPKIIEKNHTASQLSFFIHSLPYLCGACHTPFDYEWNSLDNFIKPYKKFDWVESNAILSQISYKYFFAHKDYKKKFSDFLKSEYLVFMDKMDNNALCSKIFKEQIKEFLS